MNEPYVIAKTLFHSFLVHCILPVPHVANKSLHSTIAFFFCQPDMPHGMIPKSSSSKHLRREACSNKTWWVIGQTICLSHSKWTNKIFHCHFSYFSTAWGFLLVQGGDIRLASPSHDEPQWSFPSRKAFTALSLFIRTKCENDTVLMKLPLLQHPC